MKLKKLLVASVMAIFAVLAPLCASAAPATLSPYAASTASDLIVVTNPPSFSSTTQKGVVFCGYGQSGTTVSLYLYDSASGVYRQLTAPAAINASGVFWRKVTFSGGTKNVIVYAERNGQHQIVKRQVTVLDSSISSKMYGYSVNLNSDLQMGR